MTSIVLPTRTWGDCCDQLARQLTDDDELIVVCDDDEDPVRRSAAATAATNVSVVAAGDPSQCSGKANAVAAGIEHASSERIVCTDDDFERSAEWLRCVESHLEHDEAVTTYPKFLSDGLNVWTCFEPALHAAIVVQAARGTYSWGGLFAFDRSTTDTEALVSDLRRTVSDSAAFERHFDSITVATDLSPEVPIGGELSVLCSRIQRFLRRFVLFSPGAAAVVTAASATYAAFLAALPAVVVPTTLLGFAAFYVRERLRRLSFLCAPLALVLIAPLVAIAWRKKDFEWGGRRYVWNDKFDVTIRGDSS